MGTGPPVSYPVRTSKVLGQVSEFRARQFFFFIRNVLTFEFLLPAAISPINVCFCSNFGLRKEKEKRIFGYSVKVFSYPDWKLPTCSETGQAESICFSLNKQYMAGLNLTSAR